MSNIPQTLTRLSQSLGILSVHQVSDAIIPTNTVGNIASATGSLLNGSSLPRQAGGFFNNVGAGLGQAAANLGAAASALSDETDFIASNRIVGAVYGFTLRQTRTNIRRHGINSPIEAFAIVPGPVSSTLEINQAALYIQDAMQAFAFDSGNVAFQTRPLTINEIVTPPDILVSSLSPGPSGGNIAQNLLNQLRGSGDKLSDSPIIHTYVGCWISNHSIEYKLQDDQMVIQDLTMDVARIINPTVLEQQVILGQRSLANNVRLTRAVGTINQVTGIFQGINPLRRS